MSTRVAPNPRSRSTSSSRSHPTGLTSRWMRFFTDFFSGTESNTSKRSGNGAPDSDIQRAPSSVSCTFHPSTFDQKSATRAGSMQSMMTSRSAAPMRSGYGLEHHDRDLPIGLLLVTGEGRNVLLLHGP